MRIAARNPIGATWPTRAATTVSLMKLLKRPKGEARSDCE